MHLSHTEPGGKLRNEDVVLTGRHPLAPEAYLFVLADGQGGRANAAEAARAAVESVWQAAGNTAPDVLRRPGEWERILRAADLAVSRTGGFSTLVAAVVGDGFVSGGSSGDSKAFLSSSAGAKPIELTAKQRKNPPVGSGSATFTTFFSPVGLGSRVLIVSDGVWKYCGQDALASSSVVPLPALVQTLRSALQERVGSTLPDDFSLIALDVLPNRASRLLAFLGALWIAHGDAGISAGSPFG